MSKKQNDNAGNGKKPNTNNKKANNNKRPNNTNKKSKPKQSPITSLSVTRYTFDAWMKCYPDSNELEWYEKTCPDSLVDFIATTAVSSAKQFEQYNLSIPTMAAVLDDEYWEWLKDRENTATERASYAREMSKKDALRLARKHGMDYSYTVCLYPLMLGYDEYRMSNKRVLSKETCAEFAKYLRSVMPKLGVYVLPYCLEMKHAQHYEERLINMTKSFLDNKVEIVEKKWENVHGRRKSLISLYCIPVVFREKHNTMTFVPSEIYADKNIRTRGMHDMAFSQDFFDEYGIEGVTPFLETNISEMMRKDLKISCPANEFADFFIGAWEVDEFYENVANWLDEDD